LDCTQHAAALSTVAASCTSLREISLCSLPAETAMEFVKHCPDMCSVHIALGSDIPVALLNAIAHNWVGLQILVVWRPNDASAREWTNAHEVALVNVIRRLPALTVVVTTQMHDRREEAVLDVLPVGCTRALRVLKVTHLTATALHRILAYCPGLSEIVHAQTPAVSFLSELAASHVKRVFFLCRGLASTVLEPFRGLEKLYMCFIGSGWEKALVSLAERSPQLKDLHLYFKDRPSLCLLPDMLRHTPTLRKLYVGAGLPGRDDQDELHMVLKSLVRTLCPACQAVDISI
jgi:hypothetical protein